MRIENDVILIVDLLASLSCFLLHTKEAPSIQFTTISGLTKTSSLMAMAIAYTTTKTKQYSRVIDSSERS